MTHQELSQMIAKSPVAAINQHLLEKPPKKVKKVEAFSKYKAHIHQVLSDYCIEKGYTLLTEHRFHDARKFRFDWAIKEIMIAVEYNGIFSEKSRHTTVGGYSKDREKVNLATGLGWKVLEYTPLNYTNIIEDLIGLK